jgi:HlyD family secretion protein
VNRRRETFLAAAAISTLLGSSACAGGSSKAGASPSPTPPAVKAVRTERATIHPALNMPGAIAPDESVAISSSVDEPTQAVYVREGDRVRAGQLLAQLQTDDLQANLQSAIHTAAADDERAAQAYGTAVETIAQSADTVRQDRAQLQQTEQTLSEAQRNQQRDLHLVGEGYLPSLNLDEQRVVVRNDIQSEEAARAALDAAVTAQRVNGTQSSGLQEQQIAQAREEAAAQHATALQLEREIARAGIVSPVDGIVINRNLNAGEYPSGRQLFTIEANSVVYAILTASSVQAYEISPNDPASLVRSGMPRARFFGRVVAVLDAATAGSTNFTVKVAIPNRNGALRAGTPVDAVVNLRPVSGVRIPVSAFTDDSRTQVVAIVNGRAQPVRVAEIATDGTNSIVEGIKTNVQIAVDGTAGLTNGQNVSIVR